MFLNSLLVLSLLPNADAKPGDPPKCDWSGGGKDAFTGADARTLELSLLLGQFVLAFHPVANGTSTVDITVTYGRATDQPLTKPLLLLLADGSVAPITLAEPVAGSLVVVGHTMVTKFKGSGSVTAEAVERMATGGATQIRVEFPGFQYDNELGKPGQKRLAAIGYCVAHPE